MSPGGRPVRVLVTDGDSRSALAVVRSLGRRGYSVVTSGERRRCIAAASRYSTGFVQYPSPAREPDAFVATVLESVGSRHIDILIPTTDVTTLLLTRHRARLPAGCALPFSTFESISEASDKARLVDLAQKLGVPVPGTTVIASPAELALHAGRMRYPLVIKPARSRVRVGSGWVACGVRYASSERELLAITAGLLPEMFPLLLQERITGEGVGVFACYDRGSPVAFFSHRRLREKPPSGGVSVLSESAPLDPDALELSTRLLHALSWHGVAMVEFKRDDRDGSLRLMEINARFWGSLQLAIDSGVDFPALLADLARQEPVSAPSDYKVGVRNRWLLGDLDVLISVMRSRRSSLNLPTGFPSRLGLLVQFMRFWRPDLHYDVLRLEDPMPGIVEFAQWLSIS